MVEIPRPVGKTTASSGEEKFVMLVMAGI